MGCITSSNHRKKYLEDHPENLQQNLPPLNHHLPKTISAKSRKDSTQMRINSQSQTSERNAKGQTEKTEKLQFEVQKEKIRKLSGRCSQKVSNQSTQRQNSQKAKSSKINVASKESLQALEKEQQKMIRQEQKILQILKRSQKISRIYRKVCSKMMQHNGEEAQQLIDCAK